MPTKRKATRKTKSYRVLERGRGLIYPALRSVRDRKRAGERIPLGEVKRHKVGDKITTPPDDLIDGWLRKGIVELISTQTKGATDDA